MSAPLFTGVQTAKLFYYSSIFPTRLVPCSGQLAHLSLTMLLF